MKKLQCILLALVLVLASCNNKDSIWNVVDDIDSRVATLETLCQEMNTNIAALETLIKAQNNGDYIVNITEIRNGNTIVGYTITFKHHDPITIYNGTNGKDGRDGVDGYKPVVGAKQDTDGVYYWTVDGNWLTDANGNKIRVTGDKGDKGDKGDTGDKGQDGQDGIDGTDGKDGQDGINGNTPQLKIDGGYWYISYDGTNWTQLGKATGENGKDGTNGSDGANGDKGDKGDKGDSMFSSVTQDDNYVYFTLADGTLIKIAKNGSSGSGTGDQPNSEFMFEVTYDANGGVGTMPKDTFYYGKSKALLNCAFGKDGFAFVGWNTQRDGSGAMYYNADPMIVNKDVTLYAQWKAFNGLLPGVFSVSPTRKVQFASGNLQYQASTNTWRFATNQYDYIGSKNAKISATNTDWIDLFGYGTSGVNYAPYLTYIYAGVDDYEHISTYYYPRNDIYGTDNDWGVNEIQNTTYTGWWTLSATTQMGSTSYNPDNGWQYITYECKKRITFAIVNGINGLLLLPDDWKQPVGLTTTPTSEHFCENDYSLTEWIILASNGAVFLPAAGYRVGTYIYDAGSKILYWSSRKDAYEDKKGSALVTYENGAYTHNITRGCTGYYNNFPRISDGLAVRLVRDVQ